MSTSTTPDTMGVPSSSSTPKLRTLKMLQCKFCNAMIANEKAVAIAHFKQCQAKSVQPPPPPPPVEKPRPPSAKCPFCKEILLNDKTLAAVHTKKCLDEAKAKLRELEKNYPRPKRKLSPVTVNTCASKKKRGIQRSKLHCRKVKMCWMNDLVPLYKTRDFFTQKPICLPFTAFRCPVCRLRFGNAILAGAHTMGHITHGPGQRNGAATIAAKRLPLSCNVSFVWMGKTGSDAVLCSRRFRSLVELEHHRLSHTARFKLVRRRATRRWRKTLGKGRFKLRWMMPVWMSEGEVKKKVLVCPHCSRTFTKCSSYKKHILLKSVMKFKRKNSVGRKTRHAKLISTYLNLKRNGSRRKRKIQSNLNDQTDSKKNHSHETLTTSDPNLVPLRTLIEERFSRVRESLSECQQCVEAWSTVSTRGTPPPGRLLYTKDALQEHNKKYHLRTKCRNCPETFIGSLATHKCKPSSARQTPAMNFKPSSAGQPTAMSARQLPAMNSNPSSARQLPAMNSNPSSARQTPAMNSKPSSARQLPAMNSKPSSARQLPAMNSKPSSARQLPAMNSKPSSARQLPAMNSKPSSARQSPVINPGLQGRVERSYVCFYPECRKKFIFLRALRSHVKTHSWYNTTSSDNEEPALIVKNEWEEPENEDSQENSGWSILPLVGDALWDSDGDEGEEDMHVGGLDPLE